MPAGRTVFFSAPRHDLNHISSDVININLFTDCKWFGIMGGQTQSFINHER